MGAEEEVKAGVDGAEVGAEEGVRALRWSHPPWDTGLGDCLEDPPTGVEGSEAEPFVDMGRGSWVGFLGEEGVIWRVFLRAEAPIFLGNVGVQTGEGV